MAAASSKYKLVIVESPAKAKTIGKFLGRGYKVEACNGHVRDLPKSQIGVDVEHNFEPRYITIRGRGEILEKIRKEARGASKVILATDPDREGEAISWHLANILKIDPASDCRVEFNEITAQAVKAAMKKPRPINLQLVDAQQARRVLDRLVGYKISPLLWAKVRKGLSAGRVQSVATRMIVDREAEIDAFVPQEYWTITAKFTDGNQKFVAKYVGKGDEKTEITSEAQAKEVRDFLLGQTYSVTAVKSGERRKNPPPPFTTSNLQQEAVRKLSFTTKKTMQIAQMLYEGVDIEGEGSVGLISYIRTDSTRLSDEALTAAREYIADNFRPEYLPETPNVFKGRKNAQDAHEAIRPTHALYSPEKVKASLTRDQYRLYKLIYDRYLASQMTPAVYETLNIELAGGGAQFRFGGMKKKFAGFTVLYEEGQDEPAEKETALPKVAVGDSVTMADLAPEQHFTQPPPRYTEASLVRAMEEKGIGRPSTYAPTITTILARGYVTRENKALVPTELGVLVTEMMTENFKSIVDMQFTADMEEELDTVEEDGKDWHEVIEKFYGPFSEQLEAAEKNIEKVEVKDEVSDVQCDKCGAMMVYKMGRFGKFLACPNFPACRNTMPIVRAIDAHCPKCGGAILVRNTKRGRVFYGCERYPECDFTSWDMPVDDRCPVCGSPMVLKRDRKKDISWHVCTNESCKHRVEVETPAQDEAE
ncbi:MAG TPA: type I DNA topoisomerase [Candidatus Spyradocola merdavium]|nr:type I DNA topoisomerase [Candidatus Spyradocola merdavium]